MAYENDRDAILAAQIDQLEVKSRYDEGRARKILADAEMKELDLAEQRGDLLRRSAYQTSSVMVISMFTQAMRSLPDRLERTANLSPVQAQQLQAGIDEALAGLSEGLQKLTKDKA